MFKKSFRLVITSALILGLVSLAGCGTTAPAAAPAGSNAPAAEKILKVGSDIAYAPFEFMDDKQQPVGFDIDLMTAVAKDMGYKAQFETSPFDGLNLSLASGKYDAVISAMTITDDRAKVVAFSDRYFLATQYVATKKDSGIKTVADLKGKRVGVQNNTTGQYAMENMGINPKKYDTTPDALTDLANGGLDAVVADSPVVLYYISKNPNANLVAIKGDFPKEYYGIAIKKDNTELLNKVNASLKKLMSDGTYAQIYKKWFNEDPPSLN